MTHWPDDQLLRILPPQTRDLRGLGFAAAMNGLVAQEALGDFYVRNAATCPSAALPALIAEYSLEEFIEPGMPEAIVRLIIQHAWMLQESKGYDDGVRLGLSLLGMSTLIEHWYQMVPQGVPNTNRITVYAGEQLFTNAAVMLGEREVKAALRMIDATKRWSQESTIAVGARLRQPKLGVAARIRVTTVTRTRMAIIRALQTQTATLGVAASMRARSITLVRRAHA